MTESFRGVFPIAPTPFDERGALDLVSQKRVLDCMIDQGVDGICILANYSEQFLLTDEERDVLLDLCLTHIAGRVPTIVTCSHFSTQIAAERARRAGLSGAAMIMLMPPYHGANLRAGEAQVIEHFSAIAESGGVPVMIQDAPLSGVELSVPLLVRLANEVPLVGDFKLEMPMTAAKLRSLIEAGGDAIVGPFDGEESITLLADLNAGATGTMPSALLPDLIKPVLESHREGNIDSASAQYNRILPIINFENRQCGLRACKAIMKEGGVIASDVVRHPLTPLHPETRAELIGLASNLDPVVLKWAR